MSDASVTIKANQVFDVGPVSAVDAAGNPVPLPDVVQFSASNLDVVQQIDAVTVTIGAIDQSGASSGQVNVACGSLPLYVIDVTVEAVVLPADHLVVPIGAARDR